MCSSDPLDPLPPSATLPAGRFIELHWEQAARLNCERIFSATSGISPIRRTQILGLRALLPLFQIALRRRVDIEFCRKRIFPSQSYREVNHETGNKVSAVRSMPVALTYRDGGGGEGGGGRGLYAVVPPRRERNQRRYFLRPLS